MSDAACDKVPMRNTDERIESRTKTDRPSADLHALAPPLGTFAPAVMSIARNRHVIALDGARTNVRHAIAFVSVMPRHRVRICVVSFVRKADDALNGMHRDRQQSQRSLKDMT